VKKYYNIVGDTEYEKYKQQSRLERLWLVASV